MADSNKTFDPPDRPHLRNPPPLLTDCFQYSKSHLRGFYTHLQRPLWQGVPLISRFGHLLAIVGIRTVCVRCVEELDAEAGCVARLKAVTNSSFAPSTEGILRRPGG